MQSVTAWVQQIAFLVLFAGLVEIVLPSGEVRKAVRLVVGLVVMLAVVEPFTGWVADPDGGLVEAVAERLVDDATPFINAGTELAEGGFEQARTLWKSQAERELGALLGLVDGVQQARVAVSQGDRFGAGRLLVLLSIEPGVTGEAERERVISRVKSFVIQLFPHLGTEAVDVRVEDGGSR